MIVNYHCDSQFQNTLGDTGVIMECNSPDPETVAYDWRPVTNTVMICTAGIRLWKRLFQVFFFSCQPIIHGISQLANKSYDESSEKKVLTNTTGNTQSSITGT